MLRFSIIQPKLPPKSAANTMKPLWLACLCLAPVHCWISTHRIPCKLHTRLFAEPIRLNKVFKATHSRRQADRLIADGRVRVNDERVIDMGRKVAAEDRVELDGELYVGWVEANGLTQDQTPEYIKYWKPVGIVSTTDRSIDGNLLDALESTRPRYQAPVTERIFSVGRLDKDSSGLLLLTSDGRLPNAVLRAQCKRPKTYLVDVDRPLRDSDLKGLRSGVTITTDRVRGGRHESITAKTRPCQVEVVAPTRLRMTLEEGRNRQIRVMLATMGYTVLALERIDFMGIGLDGLHGPGDWKRVDERERDILLDAIKRARAVEALETE